MFYLARQTTLGGRPGIDVSDEARGACREGRNSRNNNSCDFIVANDESYALAA